MGTMHADPTGRARPQERGHLTELSVIWSLVKMRQDDQTKTNSYWDLDHHEQDSAHTHCLPPKNFLIQRAILESRIRSWVW
jgi:hypothetical protein